MDRAKAKSRQKLKKLLELLHGNQHLLIVMQDHPDPDAIAAATALREIAHLSPEVNCSIAHGGIVGRAENRALISYLDLNLRMISEIDFASFDLLALVDTQPGTGNNSLPEGVRPHIVIDHHPMRRASRGLPFSDIRSSYGATSTILCEYMQAAGLKPTPPLATALLYGIRSDTQELAREACKADTDAHLYLYPLANLRMLAQIEHGTLPAHYYQLLYKALSQAKQCGDCVFADLGRVENPDMMGEVADLLVRLEGVEWCLCTGAFSGKILLSLRKRPASPDKIDAVKVAKRTVRRDGTSGGHQLIAGGQALLERDSDAEIARIQKMLYKRFVNAVGQKGKPEVPLVDRKIAD